MRERSDIFQHIRKKSKDRHCPGRSLLYYYHENLELLKEQGAELVQASVPFTIGITKGLDGQYLAGYPENYAEAFF